MRCVLLSVCLAALAILPSHSSRAQVSPDNNLNTSVTTLGSDSTITNGTAAGSNLFHSFEQFSVPTGGSATFDLVNTPNISTIFSRVTGGSVSNIDGMIQTINGSNPVSLFLINPAGILFGPNASLNIGGSFVGTTASSIQFADGTEFSAVNPTATPLLTVSVPIGLQMGPNPGSITHESTYFATAPGQTLALIGGDFTLQGTAGYASLYAPDGHIELGSVGSHSLVSLTPSSQGWAFDYRGVSTFRDLTLTQSAAVDASGNGGGTIQLQGNQIQITDGSQVDITTQGAVSGGEVTLRGTDVTLRGSLVGTLVSGSGQGAMITIEAQRLWVDQGGAVVTETLGEGNAGDVRIRSAVEVVLTGWNENLQTSLIGSIIQAEVSGQGGTITIETQRLLAKEGGAVATQTAGEGNTGDIHINAAQVQVLSGGAIQTAAFAGTGKAGNLVINASDFTEIRGVAPFELIDNDPQAPKLSSGLFTSTVDQAQGQGGNLSLTTGRLLVTEGGVISALTEGPGNAGTINIRAQEIEVSEPQVDFRSVSGIISTVGANSTGQGGVITLTADRVRLVQGGQVLASSFGNGPAGNIRVNAGSVEISGVSSDGQFTSQLAATSNGAFSAGSITVQSDRLQVSNGGAINNSTAGQGNAGAISILTDHTTLDRGTISSQSSGAGQAGAINLFSQTLALNNNATISSAASSTGQAGSLNLQADRTTLLNNSQIITRSTGTSDGGTVNLTGKSLTLRNNASINASTASGNGGNINLNLSELLYLRDRSQLNAEAGGTGNGGNININALFILGWGNSDIIANAFEGKGGNIHIATQGIYGLKLRPQLTPKNDITASSQFGLNGTVAITDPAIDPTSGLMTLPTSLVDPSRQIATGCESKRDSSFVITGRGGIPQNPTQKVRRDRTWADTRDLSEFRTAVPTVSSHSTTPPAIVEASILRQTNGQLELVAMNSPAPLPQAATCAKAIVPAL